MICEEYLKMKGKNLKKKKSPNCHTQIKKLKFFTL